MKTLRFITNLPGNLVVGRMERTYLDTYGLSLDFISRIVVDYHIQILRSTRKGGSLPESLLFCYSVEHNRIESLNDYLKEYVLCKSLQKPNMQYIASILHQHYIDITDKLNPLLIDGGLLHTVSAVYVCYCTPTEILMEISYNE